MRKEIITADLLARVQWGVKCETTKWQNNGQGKPMSKAVGKLIGYSERTGYEVVFNEEDFAEDFDKVKPLLFPSLTAPITVAGYNDGKMFIPIVELALRCISIFDKKEGYFPLDYCDKWINSDGSVTMLFNDDVCFELRVRFTEHRGLICELTCPQKLKWDYTSVALEFIHLNHINYQLLPGEYIEATNEYA